jgi:curli biogenesis system outer membrane secretion channel CsgG
VFVFSRIGVVTLLAACGALAPAASVSSASTAKQAAARQTAQVQSVTGRITAIAGNTFKLETAASQPSGHGTIDFTVDQETVVEGKIEVGSKADVTYRQQDGNNIAVSVRISSQS